MRITTKPRNFFAAAALAVSLCAVPVKSSAGIALSITIAPPVLPVYVQPACPMEGYLWTPGYWAWGPAGYYWVPGVWVAPPRVGFLWTPGYWGFGNGAYLWHAGYWGPHVGFYGGVNYGFGYMGLGFVGGYWSGGLFRYNTAVMNVNTTVIRNVYVDRNVINHAAFVNNRASFNGPGGVMARPSAQEQAALREQHFQPTATQIAHREAASQDRSQFASVNHGRPAVAAMDSVNGRRFNQQGRIANGIASGRLTAGESGNLERREANVNGEIRSDRRANDGRLTPQERHQVNRQQNNLGQSIYADKHNGANAQYGNNRVDARRQEQQQRISQGARSGEMTPGETARAENRERNINRQVNADRRTNGGKLTPAERNNVNREQNRASRQIYQEKHNDKVAPR